MDNCTLLQKIEALEYLKFSFKDVECDEVKQAIDAIIEDYQGEIPKKQIDYKRNKVYMPPAL